MKSLKFFISLFVGTNVYCYLMWYQTLGINALIFAVLLISAVFWYKKELRNNRLVRILALSFFLSALAVALNGITFSRVVYYLAMLTFLGFVQMPQLRSIVFGWSSMIRNFLAGIKTNFQSILDMGVAMNLKKRFKKRDVRAAFSRILVVTFLTLIFFFIFYHANQFFREFCWKILSPVDYFFDFMSQYFMPFDILHYIFIFYFLSLFFLVFQQNKASEEEATYVDELIRRRNPQSIVRRKETLSMKLKDEYKTAKMSVLVINLLLLAVNLTDIFSVWLGIVPDEMSDLAEFVHTGTYMLIVSALLSMGILLFFFRENLNHYSGNKQLVQFSNIWICQNIFMLVSVGLRNIHYINYYGLTYKRIGVFIFLLITGLALFFLYRKINRRKTFFYYLRTCGWSVFGTLLIAGFINWDLVISKNNVSPGVKQDYEYIQEELSKQSLVFLPEEFHKDGYIHTIETRDWQSFTFWEYWAAKKMKMKPEPKFVFLGEKGEIKDNFNADIKVTKDNIDTLYCHYNVSKILEYPDTTYYVVYPKQIYQNERWFSRLIQMVDGSQTVAITFYDYSIHFIDKMEDNLLIGFGSLRVSYPPYAPSNFDCRFIILDKYLNKLFEKVFDFRQFQQDNYTFIDTMYLTKNGFYMELKNINVDNNGDSCYYYTATFDKTGNRIESTKSKIGFDGNIPDYSKSIDNKQR